MNEIKAQVIQAGTPDDTQPVRFSIELSPAVHQNMVKLLAQGSNQHSIDELLSELESYLGVALFHALADLSGVALKNTPFPQNAEVEMRIIQRSTRLRINLAQRKSVDSPPIDENS